MSNDITYKIRDGSHFWENRVTFGPFVPESDVDPRSRKIGVCGYSFIVALILRLFIDIVDVPVKNAKGKIEIIHLNKNSFKKWISRHGGKPANTPEQSIKVLQEICKRYKEEMALSSTQLTKPKKIVPKKVIKKIKLPKESTPPVTAPVTAPQTALGILKENKPSPDKVERFNTIIKDHQKLNELTQSQRYTKTILEQFVQEAEKLCYHKDGKLNNYAQCFKIYSSKHSDIKIPSEKREQARLLKENAKALRATIPAVMPKYHSPSRTLFFNMAEATRNESEATTLEKQAAEMELKRKLDFETIVRTNAPNCTLSYGNYKSQPSSPEEIFSVAQPKDLPAKDAIFYTVGNDNYEVFNVSERSFKFPLFMHNSQRSEMGFGLRFYPNSENAAAQFALQFRQAANIMYEAKVSPTKVAFIKNALALEALRDYFHIVAKAYLEINYEETKNACGEYVAIAHLGDALMTNFFKRQGFDAIYNPQTQCMMLFDPSKALCNDNR